MPGALRGRRPSPQSCGEASLRELGTRNNACTLSTRTARGRCRWQTPAIRPGARSTFSGEPVRRSCRRARSRRAARDMRARATSARGSARAAVAGWPCRSRRRAAAALPGPAARAAAGLGADARRGRVRRGAPARTAAARATKRPLSTRRQPLGPGPASFRQVRGKAPRPSASMGNLTPLGRAARRGAGPARLGAGPRNGGSSVPGPSAQPTLLPRGHAPARRPPSPTSIVLHSRWAAPRASPSCVERPKLRRVVRAHHKFSALGVQRRHAPRDVNGHAAGSHGRSVRRAWTRGCGVWSARAGGGRAETCAISAVSSPGQPDLLCRQRGPSLQYLPFARRPRAI